MGETCLVTVGLFLCVLHGSFTKESFQSCRDFSFFDKELLGNAGNFTCFSGQVSVFKLHYKVYNLFRKKYIFSASQNYKKLFKCHS